ncbi:HVA1 family protein [Sagittula stellata]
MKNYGEGERVEWDWGSGTASGKVVQKYTRKITLKIKGTEVTRDADEDNPAYRIEQEDGGEVLKKGSELRKA